jgi:hypothetical protein
VRVPRGQAHLSALTAQAQGFSLHAGVATEAGERSKLERLCRCIARPAVSTGRLALTWMPRLKRVSAIALETCRRYAGGRLATASDLRRAQWSRGSGPFETAIRISAAVPAGTSRY